jgi:hypothetical protein
MVRATRFPLTVAVFLASVVVRCLLLPITYGPDFLVWDLASKGTLDGINIYAHHPAGYLGGPYTYPPLFLYVELPFQWLAIHTGLPFTVLGKLPIVAGDLLTGYLIALFLAKRHHGDGRIALASAAYLLNPLVLYNGAFYGRFDAVCAGLFLLALHLHVAEGRQTWRFASVYAAAIATKIYPVFLLPWLWMKERRSRPRLAGALLLVVGGLSLPYIATSPRAFVSDILLYNLNRTPSNLSWQIVLLDRLPYQTLWIVGALFLVLFGAVLCRLTTLDVYSASLIGILVFLLLSKLVIEQYLLWTFPFLIQQAAHARSRPDLALFTIFSVAGMLSNHYIHPFGERVVVLNVILAAATLAYIVNTLRPSVAR